MARYLVNIHGEEYDIELEYRSEKYYARIGGEEKELEFHRLTENRLLILIDGQSNEVDIWSNGFDHSRTVFVRGREYSVGVEDYNLAQLRKTAGMTSESAMEKELHATMPGMVVDIKVEAGEAVTAGQPLLVIEAMKMENVIKAKSDATVKMIKATAGRSVEKGDILLEFE